MKNHCRGIILLFKLQLFALWLTTNKRVWLLKHYGFEMHRNLIYSIVIRDLYVHNIHAFARVKRIFQGN